MAVPWDVFLHGRYIDTVYFDSDMTHNDVLQSLINHDGMNPAIVVVKRERHGYR